MRTTALTLMVAALMATTAFADSNAVPGDGISASQMVTLGGPFDHDGAEGNLENSIETTIFTGSFTPTNILIEGTITPDAGSAYDTSDDGSGPFVFFLSEAEIVVTDPNGGDPITVPLGISDVDVVDATNPDGSLMSFPFSASFNLPGQVAANAGDGEWSFEFGDGAPDNSAGPDHVSNNVEVTLRIFDLGSDSDGNFSLGSIDSNGATSVGELLDTGLIDRYTFSLAVDGQIDISTAPDANGFSGDSIGDTQIGLFDNATGLLMAFNDDVNGPDPNFYSELVLDLPAGDYTLAVIGFESPNLGFSEIGSLLLADVIGGNDATGDYSLSISFVPDEPEILLGDVNMSGEVNFSDIRPFIGVLSGGTFQAEADCDENGEIEFADIRPFIGILSGSGS